ncbi:uncharacterized protein [Dysidea avara]|uniref:uncharacterized protein n=1 Tax=Dysidea avara TaxID=196820 RepID=UPI003319D029
MFSKLFVLSPRGDTIVLRDYRHDLPDGVAEMFYKEVKKWQDTHDTPPPPAINCNGVQFVYIRRNSLYIVCATKFNISPACGIELLTRVSNLFKDYCGVFNEESIRLNFVLIYELLDEVLDFGYPQVTSTETLKSYVHNSPVETVFGPTESVFLGGRRTLPSTAANKPIAISLDNMKSQKNEVFVDLLERLTAVVAANGNVIQAHLDGCIQMKSFLAGSPEIKFALNEDLVVGPDAAHRSRSNVVLDDCKFHECVNLAEFEHDKVLHITPPDGEFLAMTYRLSGDFAHSIPLRVYGTVEQVVDSPKMVRVVAHIQCSVPPKTAATNIVMRIPVPKTTISATCDNVGAGQMTEFKQSEKLFIWRIKKLEGGSELMCRIKLLQSEVTKATKKEINAINLDFEIPMFICSGLQIRFLRVFENNRSYSPFRWVRYITHSDSCVFRL